MRVQKQWFSKTILGDLICYIISAKRVSICIHRTSNIDLIYGESFKKTEFGHAIAAKVLRPSAYLSKLSFYRAVSSQIKFGGNNNHLEITTMLPHWLAESNRHMGSLLAE